MRRSLLPGLALLCAFGLTGPKARAQTVVVSLSASAYAIGETNVSMAMVVNRGGATNVAFTVDYATTNGTATDGQDYVAQCGTLAFAAGVNSRVFTIPILDDGLVEGDELVFLSLGNPSGGAVLDPQSAATLVIHDNETPSLLDVSFDPGSGFGNDVFALASQPDGKILAAGQFTSFNTSNRTRIARLNADGSLDQSFDPGTGADGDIYVVAWQPDGKVLVGGAFTTVNGTGNRYVARLNADGSVDDTFAPGSSVNNDLRALAVQPDGKILIAGRFTTVAGQTRNRIARLNEDGTLDTTFNPGTGANNNVRSMALQVDGRILIGGQFTTVNGTSRVRVARLLSNGLLDASFNPGSGADDQVRALAVRGDGMIYIGGDFEIYNGTNRSAVARLFANGDLDLSFDQGNPSDDNVRTLLPLADGSVWIGGAFQMSGGQPRANLAWLDASGVAAQAGTLPLAVDDEVFTLLADAHGRLLAGGKFAQANGVARRRVARWWPNPSLNTFEFISAVFQGNEVTGQAIITVRRNGESSNTVSVVCATADGTATAGADYSAQTQTLNFGPLETIKTFVVPIQNDGVAEGTETVRLTLDQASPGIVPGPGAVLEITDDAGRIGFAVSAVDIGEAAGSVVLAVTRTGNSGQAVSVDFYTTNGTAISGVDYFAQAGTLTFAPGVITLYLPVPILNDTLQETNESFSVTLAHPTGGGVFGPQTNVAVTIIDNELGVGFTGTYRIIDEGFSSVRLSVIKQWDATNRVLVDYATGDGTATAGLDYVAQSGTLAFEPGEFEKGIDIILLKDALHEDAEDFAVILGNVRGGVTLKISSIDVIIACEAECDTGIEFDSPLYAVTESGGSVTLGVRRGDDVTNTFTVHYWTSNGTAMAGIDYLPQSGTLTLLPGVINRDLIIPVFRDASFLSAKTFSVHLGNPSPGIELGTRQTAMVKIVDDNQPGMVDTNFNPTEEFLDLNAVTSQPDGKIVVGFGALHSWETPVARLNADGTRDVGFTPGVPRFFSVFLQLVTSVALDSSGKILCGGFGYVPDISWAGWSLRRLDPYAGAS